MTVPHLGQKGAGKVRDRTGLGKHISHSRLLTGTGCWEVSVARIASNVAKLPELIRWQAFTRTTRRNLNLKPPRFTCNSRRRRKYRPLS